MARLPRLSAPGRLHPVIQRGNNGQAIFQDAEDRDVFLRLLAEAVLHCEVALHAYALVDTEVLLLATPKEASGLSQMMQAVGRRYVAAFNRRHARTGTLWEGRFRATVAEPETQLHACLSFVELAPVRAAAVRAAEESPWSSAAHHLGLRADPMVTDHPLYWALGNTPFEREASHRKLLEHALTFDESSEIREATLKGWALGSSRFVDLIEEETGRRAKPGRRGRPPAGHE
jgi:putative transposase